MYIIDTEYWAVIIKAAISEHTTVVRANQV